MEENNMVLEVVLIEFVGEKYSVFSFLHGERFEKEEIEKERLDDSMDAPYEKSRDDLD